MGKYDILVEDAEFNLRIAKRKQAILNTNLEWASKKLEKAEEDYYNKSTTVCNHEKIVRSLSAKLSWAKRKNKL